jgi:hypothetical protein
MKTAKQAARDRYNEANKGIMPCSRARFSVPLTKEDVPRLSGLPPGRFTLREKTMEPFRTITLGPAPPRRVPITGSGLPIQSAGRIAMPPSTLLRMLTDSDMDVLLSALKQFKVLDASTHPLHDRLSYVGAVALKLEVSMHIWLLYMYICCIMS